MVKIPSDTLNLPHWRAKVKMESLVIPGKIKPFKGGVINSFSIKKEKPCQNKMKINFLSFVFFFQTFSQILPP